MPTQMSRRPRSFVYRRVLKRPLVNRAVLSLLLRVVSRTVSNVERTFTVWSRAIHSGFHNDDASAVGFHPVTHANSSASRSIRCRLPALHVLFVHRSAHPS